LLKYLLAIKVYFRLS